jgi:hypothetical protein
MFDVRRYLTISNVWKCLSKKHPTLGKSGVAFSDLWNRGWYGWKILQEEAEGAEKRGK